MDSLNIILIILNFNSLLIGFILGRYIVNNGVSLNTEKSFFAKQKEQREPKEHSSISIDDKKFVVDIKTDSLEKKYSSLGDIKQTEDNITNSVNKLKNLKG